MSLAKSTRFSIGEPATLPLSLVAKKDRLDCMKES
jgi:hypothetical protein